MISFKACSNRDGYGEFFKSGITSMTFPAGEIHLKQDPQRKLEPLEIAIMQPTPDSIHSDLFTLNMWIDYLWTEFDDNRVEELPRTLVLIPYLPGARADRGNPFGAKLYAKAIGDLRVNKVISFDPHSAVMHGILRRRFGPSAYETLRPADILSESFLRKFNGIIAPDKGAVPRARTVADKASLPLYTVEKTRDFATGKLTGFDTSGIPKGTRKEFLVVDDICDGGGTFMGLAESSGLERKQLSLYVSHGVFSGKALENLPTKFQNIYTTNSYNPKRTLNTQPYSDNPSAFHRMDVIRPMFEKL